MEFSDEFHKKHEHPQIIMEKTAQSGKRCHDLHQTDFPSCILSSQKPRNSKGFCEDNLLLQMSEQNSQGRGMTDLACKSDICPSRAGRRFLFVYQNQWRHSFCPFYLTDVCATTAGHHFYVGGESGIARIATAAAKRAKQMCPDIILMFVLPDHPAESNTDTGWI